jgi:hypothetical protein
MKLPRQKRRGRRTRERKRGGRRKQSPQAIAGRKGGLARWANERAKRKAQEAYPDPFLAFLDAAGRGGPTRAAWRVFWKAADGLPLDRAERALFRRHTGRQTPPTHPARECWLPAGRRGGKSEQMVMRATWRAIATDWRKRLSPGEVGVIPIVAPDRDQARNTLAYLRALARGPLVAPYVGRVLRDSVEFVTGAVVRVATCSWRTSRGFTMLDVLFEECAFYHAEDSANPDEEILAAFRPALLTVPGARVYGISSPYARKGILWTAYEQHWGRDGDDVLVFSADSLSLNPTLDPAAIARAFEDDPARAASEYGREGRVTFRSDVEAFISREAVQAVVTPGRLELPRVAGVRYHAFVDPSGGSQDSMTLAVAHRHADGSAVLDCLREVRPPFSPESVAAEFAQTAKAYGCSRVVGDRYAGEWPREQFRQRGVQYVPSERTKSELYVEVLPLVNAGRCALLDAPRLAAQFCALERRTGRGTGRDSIDHAPGAHDDLANAAAGALVLAAGQPSQAWRWGHFPR